MNTPELAGSVIVGIDGSGGSRDALAWAVKTASDLAAPIHLFHSLASPSHTLPREPGIQLDWPEVQHWLERKADSVRETGLAVTTELVTTDPGPGLVRASEHARMLVMGAVGHGLLTGGITGSVSQYVSRHATCPTVTVRPLASPESTRAIVGYDGSPEGDRALAFALELASTCDWPVTLIHTIKDRTLGGSIGVPLVNIDLVGSDIQEAEKLVDDAVLPWLAKYAEVALAREVVPGSPQHALISASGQAALVVVGSRGRSATAGVLLGSVSQAVLNHAQCPVAVVP